MSKPPTDQQFARACPQLIADKPKSKNAPAKHGKFGYYLSLGMDSNGKRRQVYLTRFGSQREAQDAYDTARGERAVGTYVAPKHQTLAEYLAEWLPVKATSGKGLKPTTRADYQRYIDSWVTQHRLGRMRLSEIEPHDVQRFLADMDAEGRGKVAQQRCLAVLQSAFHTAKRQRVIAVDPTDGVDAPTHETPEVEAWGQRELDTFLESAAEHRLGSLYKFAAATGLRRGEIAGLRWSDIEWREDTGKRPYLRVRNTRVEVGGTKQANIVDSTPKSRAGRRSVPLWKSAQDALVAWRAQLETERAALAREIDHDYVFTDELGDPIRPDTITKTFERLAAKVDVPRLTFHGLRHTWVCRLIDRGYPLAKVSMWAGHSSYSFTLARYGHMTDDMLDDDFDDETGPDDGEDSYSNPDLSKLTSGAESEKPQATRL